MRPSCSAVGSMLGALKLVWLFKVTCSRQIDPGQNMQPCLDYSVKFLNCIVYRNGQLFILSGLIQPILQGMEIQKQV